MNGDSGDNNGTMGEPKDTPVVNEQNSIPDPKIVNTEKLLNGTNCENSNNIEDECENENCEDGVSIGHKINKEDTLLDSQDSDTMHTDGPPEDLQEIKSINGEDPLIVSPKDDSNDSSLGKKDSQDCSNNSVELAEDTKSHGDEANQDDDSLGDCQGETNNSDDIPQLSEQENSNKGLESNHNSDDESSETGEDTVGDTISSGDTERERQQIIKDKLDDGDVKTETFQIVTINEHHSDDEMESLNSDCSGSDGELKAEDTVSLNSDSDNGEFNDSSDIIILENDGTKNHNGTSKSPEVHEIISDNEDNDCVMTVEEKLTNKTQSAVGSKTKKSPKANDSKVELRRSSRTIKRKKFDDDIQPIDDESDIEEVVLEDPLKRKSKNIFINTTKTLVDMTGKHLKFNTSQKKDATIVITDSPAATKKSSPINKNAASTLSQSIYQRIVSRGTSVTPVNTAITNNTTITKNMTTQGTQVSPTPPPPILPTLTDDMFVVEAPSFIVPYVYEKPAKLPFKEFVDKWGKEIEEEKAKEEQALLENKKEEKVKRELEKQEKRDRGEEVVESEEEVESDEIKKKKAEKAEKKERRRRKKEDDDVSWDGSSSSESEDDEISDEEGQIKIIKDKADPIDEIKDVAIEPTAKSESYFDLFLGKFFMDIGLNLVQEYVQTDLLKQQNRKLQREKRGGHDLTNRELSIALLTKNLELSQKTNAPFIYEQIKCELCTFKTESALAMAHHLETPHMKNNLYKCNYCSFEIKSPHDILYHMEKEHNVKGKLERAPALHQCANCPFEDHGKGKLARHLITCAKKYKPESNLAPPLEWEHPAKIAKVQRARSNAAPYQVAQFGRNHVDGTGFAKVPIPIANAMPPMYRARGRAPLRPAAPLLPVQARPSGVLIRHSTPAQQHNYPVGTTKKAMHPSISITPLPRQTIFTAPVPAQPLHGAKGFVICEICDGYIKDLEQLRNHMQWIHKVKIHPKMIYNRPPLNCQKCQFRFFTDQGLERHLLGSHGLVTSSMQEAANRGKDAGRCPVCGRVYQWKLLGHVSRDHNLVLKPAHLSYKCTVCTATFGMYRQFENHVYSAHSVVAKKVIDKKTGAAAAKSNANDNAAKQLKINDEITIIPQPIKMPGAPKGK